MARAFTKMHGCGNDYIYFNCLQEDLPDPQGKSIALSDRRFGIGGDGIILIRPSQVADAQMRIYNADGSEAQMCGNGIRCVGKFLYDKGIVKRQVIRVETRAGIKCLQLTVRDGRAQQIRVGQGNLKATGDSGGLAGRVRHRQGGTHCGNTVPHHVRVDGQPALCDVCRGRRSARSRADRAAI